MTFKRIVFLYEEWVFFSKGSRSKFSLAVGYLVSWIIDKVQQFQIDNRLIKFQNKHEESYNKALRSIKYFSERNGMILPSDYMDFFDWHYRTVERKVESGEMKVGSLYVKVREVESPGKTVLTIENFLNLPLVTRRDLMEFSKFREREMMGYDLPLIIDVESFNQAFYSEQDLEKVMGVLVQLGVLNDNRRWIYTHKAAIPLIVEAIVSRIDCRVEPPKVCELFAVFVGAFADIEKVHNGIKYVKEERRPKPGSKLDELQNDLLKMLGEKR